MRQMLFPFVLLFACGAMAARDRYNDYTTKGCIPTPEVQREIRAQLQEIGAAIESRDPKRMDNAAKQLASLLNSPTFRTRDGKTAVPPPSSTDALADWWARGGGEWWAIGQLHTSGRALRFPPMMRSAIDMARVPPEIICSSGECDIRASQFIETTAAYGLRLEAYERYRFFHHRWNTPRIDEPNHAQSRCQITTFEQWRGCVAFHRSVRPSFPLGFFRFPSDGWLFVATSDSLAERCPHHFAFNLTSGVALWTQGCTVSVGQGEIGAIREFALVVLLASSVEEIGEYQEVPIPREFEEFEPCSLEAIAPQPAVRSSAHTTLRYWWWRDKRIVSSGRLSPDAFDEPAGSFGLKLLDVAKGTLATVAMDLPSGEFPNSGDAELLEVVRTFSR